MKNLLIFLIVIIFCKSHHIHAQDTLKFRDGTIENVIVEEVSSTSIKYKKADNASGPSYTMPVSRLYMVVYRNGSKDIFSTPPSEPSPARTPAVTQQTQPSDAVTGPPAKPQVKFSGPRLGCTYLSPGTSAQWIIDRGKQPFVSQFGWQFETRIFTSNSGISGLAEFVPLIAGLEQGLFLPSGSILFGLRGPGGLEFAVGPNVSLTGFGMVFAAGTSFHIDDIYFPVNIAFVPSVGKATTTVSYTGQRITVKEQTGFRISLLVGFNTRKG